MLNFNIRNKPWWSVQLILKYLSNFLTIVLGASGGCSLSVKVLKVSTNACGLSWVWPNFKTMLVCNAMTHQDVPYYRA